MGLEGYLNDVKETSIIGAVAGAALAAAVAASPEGRDALMQQPLYVGALVFGTGAATAGLHTLAEVTKYVLDRAYDLGVEIARRIKDFYNFLTKDENLEIRLERQPESPLTEKVEGRKPNKTEINIKSVLLLGTAYLLLPLYELYSLVKEKFYDFIGRDQYIQP